MPTGSERMRIVSQEAAYWYFRWADDGDKMPRDDKKEFLEWTRRSPENIAEFLRVSKMDGRFARRRLRDQTSKCDSTVVHGNFGNGAAQYDYQPCASVSNKVPRKRKAWSASTWAARAAMLVMAVLLCFVYLNRSPDDIIKTAAGQWQHMNLEDGSNLHMDARTSLKVEMNPKRRLIHLRTGQAVFDVASDRNRPFTVRTDLVDVTAVGTRFSVKSDESGVTAIVEEGIVEVTPRDGQDGEAVRLYPGEELQVPKNKAKSLQLSEREKKKVDARLALQWTTGWLELQHTTLGEMAEEFNRRHAVQVNIDDPTIATKRVDYARMKVDSVESFERVMQAQEDIHVVRKGSVITVTRRPRAE